MIKYEIDNLIELLEKKEDILGCPNCDRLTVETDLVRVYSKNEYDREAFNEAFDLCNNCYDMNRNTEAELLEVFSTYDNETKTHKIITL